MVQPISMWAAGRWLAAAVGAAGLAATTAQAGTLNVLYSFTGGADGATPFKGVTIDPAGNIYGETFYGADPCPDSYGFANVGCGTLYSLPAGGTLQTLRTFTGPQNGADGFTNVTLSGKTLYGSTYSGGIRNTGLLFSSLINGRGFKVLHKFTGPDGAQPSTFARLDANGNIFSTASTGGPAYTKSTPGSGFGILFELTPDGTYIPQHDFSGGTDGGKPGRIFFDSTLTTIYGTTAIGGNCASMSSGCGVVFSFVPNTGVYTVLYTFTGANDGYAPSLGGFDKNGNVYGSTYLGGADGYGTLFKLTRTAGGFDFSTIYTFTGASDGAYPNAPPAVAGDGTLTGTTLNGPVATTNTGVLYSFARGQFTTLYTFTNDANGGYPQGTPVVAKNGVITGTAAYGGIKPCDTAAGTLISSLGCGVIYQYTP